MVEAPNADLNAQIAAAWSWWREAGVDCDFVNEPKSWLRSAEPPREAEAPSGPSPANEPAPATSMAPAALPGDLAGFREWWLREPSLDSDHLTGRIPARGAVAADLMVLVPSPEDSDRRELLTGPEGKLIDAFLAACGIDDAQVYRASVLPCHSPGADWSPTATRQLAQALIHHVAIVQPKRLLVFGMNVLPLLGHDSPQAPAVSSIFNHEGMRVPLLAVRRIPARASQPRWKSALWRAWLDWTA